MTERERQVTRLRTLLDAADILLTEANRSVPQMEKGDSEHVRERILAIHSHIRQGQQAVNAAMMGSLDVK